MNEKDTKKIVAYALYGSFKRLGKFPIDPSSYFESKDALDDYVKNSPIAYEGQQLVVYGEDNPDAGIYILNKKEGTNVAERLSYSTELNVEIGKVTEKIQKVIFDNDEFKEFIKGEIDFQKDTIINEFERIDGNIEQRFKTITTEINEKFESQDADITEVINKTDILEEKIQQVSDKQDDTLAGKIKEINEKLETVYSTKEDLNKAVEALLGFQVPDNMNKLFDTFSEIHRWIEQHNSDFEQNNLDISDNKKGIARLKKDLAGTSENLLNEINNIKEEVLKFHNVDIQNIQNSITTNISDIDKLEDLTDDLDRRVDNLELGVISNVLQTVVIDVDNDPNFDPLRDFKSTITHPTLIKSGSVIKSLKLVVDNELYLSENTIQDDFRVYLKDTQNSREITLLTNSFIMNDPDIGDNEIYNVDFSKKGEIYFFELDTPADFEIYNGEEVSKNYSLNVYIAAKERCCGKLYVDYFRRT